MKITFGKSAPYHSGWRGWSNHVDVFADGKKIGELVSTHEQRRDLMDYHFECKVTVASAYPRIGVIGLRAAKQAVRKCFGDTADRRVGRATLAVNT